MEEENQNIEKDITELTEIGKEIDTLEKRLEAVPGVEELDVKKYNRKQRRQMERQMVRNEKEQQRKLEQKGSTYVTRKEFAGLFQSAQKLRDRLYYIDVLSACFEKLLIEKNIITREELKEAVAVENEKAMKFQEIQNTEKDYENRLKKCVELEIDPNMSNIGQQIFGDPELSIDEKKRLANEYNLTILLKILEKQVG